MIPQKNLSMLANRLASGKTRIPESVLERDYCISWFLAGLAGSAIQNKLVFKGGTALKKCYFGEYRFSEDLDFTSLNKTITLNDIKSVLESQDFLEVKDEYVSKATIKIERLKYIGPLGLANSLKVEIDYTQNVVLPARILAYKNAWNVETKVNVMDIKEICAEKIRAASERARYRDFYDLKLLFDTARFDIGEIAELIGRKESRKLITQDSIFSNWK